VLYIAEDAPKVADRDVLAIAVAEQRWVLTFDRDYGELIWVWLFLNTNKRALLLSFHAAEGGGSTAPY
jgi:hypothetical protein